MNPLYQAAKQVWGSRALSPFVEAGSVAAAIQAGSGRIYTGVCIDTACALGMCAERSAIAAMITGGDSRIDRLAVMMPDGALGLPCGACREVMMQLDGKDIQILTNLAPETYISLGQLMPQWWSSLPEE